MDSETALDIQEKPAASRWVRGWIILAILVSVLVLLISIYLDRTVCP